jgi:hypothetical protein
MKDFPGSTFEAASNLCMRTNSEGTPHDYKSASQLHQWLPPEIIDLDDPPEIRNMLKILIMKFDFYWANMFPLGREAVKALLTRNEYQVFRNAELFSALPSNEVVYWWDDLSAIYRKEQINNDFREAELKSLQLEREYLLRQDCPYEPVWVALDDNSLGYDIRSYRYVINEWLPYAIEVKSTSTSKIRFYLTRNEGNLAGRMGQLYSLHYWLPNLSEPIKFSSSEILENIPINQGHGKWESALIEFEKPCK